MKTILVTGGAGYIGSHTLIELIAHNFNVVVIDNLVNANVESLRRVEKITNTTIPFIQADVRDQTVLDNVFTTYPIDAVIHFAGLKAVGESVAKPLEYYDNNLVSTLTLLKAMRKHTVKKLVFSSWQPYTAHRASFLCAKHRKPVSVSQIRTVGRNT